MVVKMTTDDDGDPYQNDYWHYISNWGDAPRLLCDGHVFGLGESAAQFETKKGKVTCPKCIAIIKELNDSSAKADRFYPARQNHSLLNNNSMNSRIIIDQIQGVLIEQNGHARGASELYKEVVQPIERELFSLQQNYNHLVESHRSTVEQYAHACEKTGRFITALSQVLEWFRYSTFGAEGEHFEDTKEYTELKKLLTDHYNSKTDL